MTLADGVFCVLGTAVLHFLWQGTLIALLAHALLSAMRNAGPAARYWVACLALLASVVAFLGTSVACLVGELGAQPESSAPVIASLIAAHGGGSHALDAPTVHSPWTIITGWAYLGGTLCLGARWLVQWSRARRLTRDGTTAPDPAWTRVFDEVRERLGVHPGVRLVRSVAAESPMVVGVFAPVVLVPASVFTSLPPDQLRAVLVHELTHISRRDPIVNALQAAVETLLFFHPAVWWLSGRIRLERELCCDDAAAASAQNPRTFAEALASLESIRSMHPHAALTANGGFLMDRIARLTGRPMQARPFKWRALSAIAIGAAVAVAGIAHTASARAEIDDDRMLEVVRYLAAAGASEDQVRVIYDTLVAPHSELEAKLADELAGAEARLDRAVESGRISPEQAQEHLERLLAKHQSARDQTFMIEALGMTKGEAYLAITRREIEAAVERGEISRDEGTAKIAEVERGVDLRAEYARHVEEAAEKIKAMVESGQISADEASAKTEAVKAEIAARMRLNEAADRLKKAVAAGEMTEAQARERLDAVKARMAGAKSDIDWNAVEARVEGAVERGDITRERADEIYAELKRKALTDRRNRDDGESPAVWIGGVITEVTNSGITLRTEDGEVRRVLVNDRTRITLNGERARLGDLRPRDRARVNGERTDRGFVASEIRAARRDHGGDDAAWIGGTISRLTDNGLILNTDRGEVRVVVTDRTRITLNGRRARLQDLQRGDGARVQGRRTDRGFVASVVNASRRDGGGDDGHGDGVWIGGTIAEIARDGITVRTEDGEVRVLVTDRTRITLNDRDAGLGDLRVRDRVRVNGLRTDRGFVAREIRAFRR